MKVSFFHSRCFICWKGFKVPKLPDSSHGDYLYYDKKEKTYSYFSWLEHKEIQDIISDFFSLYPELQTLNDNTKGNTAMQLVGLIADGDKELILGFNRCPRCSIKFNHVSKNRKSIDTIAELSFHNIWSLDKQTRQQVIAAKIKTAYKIGAGTNKLSTSPS